MLIPSVKGQSQDPHVPDHSTFLHLWLALLCNCGYMWDKHCYQDCEGSRRDRWFPLHKVAHP